MDLRIYKGPDFHKTHKLSTDIYYKNTNTFSYLHGLSFHPPNIYKAIAVGESLRVLRAVSVPVIFRNQMAQLIKCLKKRHFSRQALKAAKAIKHPSRDQTLALKDTTIRKKNFPFFQTNYYPRSVSIKKALSQHWLAIDSNSTLHRTFPNPPTVAYRTGPQDYSHLPHILLTSSTISYVTLSQHSNSPDPTPFVRLKHPVISRQNTNCSNWTCQACPLLSLCSHIKSSHTKRLFPINISLNCLTKHVIYALQCQLCGKQYVNFTIAGMRVQISKLNFHLKMPSTL